MIKKYKIFKYFGILANFCSNKLKLLNCAPVKSVTKPKLQLWDSKCAYQLCYLCVHNKSADAGTTLLGVLMWSKVKPPTLIKVRRMEAAIG
jgi:hypothetical protein